MSGIRISLRGGIPLPPCAALVDSRRREAPDLGPYPGLYSVVAVPHLHRRVLAFRVHGAGAAADVVCAPVLPNALRRNHVGVADRDRLHDEGFGTSGQRRRNERYIPLAANLVQVLDAAIPDLRQHKLHAGLRAGHGALTAGGGVYWVGEHGAVLGATEELVVLAYARVAPSAELALAHLDHAQPLHALVAVQVHVDAGATRTTGAAHAFDAGGVDASLLGLAHEGGAPGRDVDERVKIVAGCRELGNLSGGQWGRTHGSDSSQRLCLRAGPDAWGNRAPGHCVQESISLVVPSQVARRKSRPPPTRRA